MKKARFILILILFTQALSAQKSTQKIVVNEFAAIDKKALELPDSLTKTADGIAGYITANFKSDKDKSRAIFIWVASNIQYDIENMFAINFYEKKEEKISKPLRTRKGICENYAALFNDICSKSGIKSYVIEGYTKQNGFTDYIPHAWCAALIDTSWYMFDPTWGSGYVNGGKFFKKINNSYFKVSPVILIKSHIPFDYLWQFLNYPITNQEFYEGKTQQNLSHPYFNYIDTLQLYEKQNYIEQLVASGYRVEKNGVKNSMVFDRLQHIKLEIENDRQNKIVRIYNAAGADYNEGVNYYNDFINYRNKQFIPKKEDPEIQQMIDAADNKLKIAKTKLAQIQNPDANITAMITQLNKSISDIAVHVTEQQAWLNLYLSKGKSGRKSMFYDRKVTWFGIPMN
ncbi:Transglutaminase-like superfamily protein [Chitinophaga sp. CF118]|uniref:transglutaminase domain-containing protein n=1 Tax=Chitinophaga sp. CF118 TaxID=1884367 RepID=UPI0008DF1EB4|nr:transglutaminase domain-containing protein [Chitinophaga sp. CF118]SFE02217.1 Transglutaminase-like superfamily protein [Chitinophaga sp. CF118]